MKVKEELIGLFETIPHPQRLYPDIFADMLIENGVIIQKWFLAEEELPTENDADEDGHVMAISKDMGKIIANWKDVCRFKEYISYWTHIPKFQLETNA